MRIGTVELNMSNIQKIEDYITGGLIDAAETVLTDIKKSHTMPLESGVLQNDSTFVDYSKVYLGEVSIVSDTSIASDGAYARRLYFHPEYNFNREHNPKAGGKWFEPYITGDKKDMAQLRFERYISKRTGG